MNHTSFARRMVMKVGRQHQKLSCATTTQTTTSPTGSSSLLSSSAPRFGHSMRKASSTARRSMSTIDVESSLVAFSKTPELLRSPLNLEFMIEGEGDDDDGT